MSDCTLHSCPTATGYCHPTKGCLSWRRAGDSCQLGYGPQLEEQCHPGLMCLPSHRRPGAPGFCLYPHSEMEGPEYETPEVPEAPEMPDIPEMPSNIWNLPEGGGMPFLPPPLMPPSQCELLDCVHLMQATYYNFETEFHPMDFIHCCCDSPYLLTFRSPMSCGPWTDCRELSDDFAEETELDLRDAADFCACCGPPLPTVNLQPLRPMSSSSANIQLKPPRITSHNGDGFGNLPHKLSQTHEETHVSSNFNSFTFFSLIALLGCFIGCSLSFSRQFWSHKPSPLEESLALH